MAARSGTRRRGNAFHRRGAFSVFEVKCRSSRIAPIPPLCNSFGPTRWRLVKPTNPHRLEEDVLRIVERLGGEAEATEILQEYEGSEISSSAVMFAIQRALDAGTLRDRKSVV